MFRIVKYGNILKILLCYVLRLENEIGLQYFYLAENWWLDIVILKQSLLFEFVDQCKNTSIN